MLYFGNTSLEKLREVTGSSESYLFPLDCSLKLVYGFSDHSRSKSVCQSLHSVNKFPGLDPLGPNEEALDLPFHESSYRKVDQLRLVAGTSWIGALMEATPNWSLQKEGLTGETARKVVELEILHRMVSQKVSSILFVVPKTRLERIFVGKVFAKSDLVSVKFLENFCVRTPLRWQMIENSFLYLLVQESFILRPLWAKYRDYLTSKFHLKN